MPSTQPNNVYWTEKVHPKVSFFADSDDTLLQYTQNYFLLSLTFCQTIMGSGLAWIGQESFRVCPSRPTTLVSRWCCSLGVGGPAGQNKQKTFLTNMLYIVFSLCHPLCCYLFSHSHESIDFGGGGAITVNMGRRAVYEWEEKLLFSKKQSRNDKSFGCVMMGWKEKDSNCTTQACLALCCKCRQPTIGYTNKLSMKGCVKTTFYGFFL